MSGRAELLRTRRWFRAKARRVREVEERDRVEVGGAPLCLWEARFEDGGAEVYLVAGEQDALDPAPLLRAIESGLRVEGERGAFVFRAARGFAGGPPLEVARPVGGEQSNSSFALDRRFFLKIFRRLEAGPSPELEVLRFLEERTDFRRAPRFLGAIEYESGAFRATLGVLESFVESDGDLWAYTLANRPGAEVWQRLGLTTRELHRALASRREDPAFAPEPVARADLAAWSASFERLVGEVAALAGRRLLGLERPLIERARALAALDPRGLVKSRVHGDYHLGQVLRARSGFVIFDFEGEPARPLAERRRKHAPAHDVAGMLRSIGYAALVSRPRAAAASPWEDEARRGFLEGYGLEPEDRPLLEILELEKAVYEVGYEINHRPDWVDVPLAAVRRFVGAA